VKGRRKPLANRREKNYFCTVVSEDVEISLKNKPSLSLKSKNEMFVQCEKIVPVEDSPNVPLSISEAHRIADKTYPWKRTLSILRSSFE
jgi:hypothetical protein